MKTKTRNKISIILIISAFLIIPLVSNQIFSTNILRYDLLNLKTSQEEELTVEYYDYEWLINNDFSTTSPWYPTEEGGDPQDISTDISGGAANFNIEGETKSFTEISGIPQDSDWTETTNPKFPALPSGAHEINDNEGCHVSHSWNEGPNQNPSVQWERNCSVSDDMSNFIITSVSLNVVVNATVNSNIEGLGETGYVTGDYIRFYVIISDLAKNNQYEFAWNRSSPWLGTSGHLVMSDTSLTTISQQKMIDYLGSVLKTDNHNFTITLGIRIRCEDNILTDTDTFNDIYIRSCDFSFTYVRKINQLTTASWHQDGDTFSSKKYKDTNNISLVSATLNFQLKISSSWPTASSPNSELRIFINNNQNPEVVNLNTAKTYWADAKSGGFDVASIISVPADYVNFSIQLYLGDEFGLDNYISVSIDKVYLHIWYKEIGEIPPQPAGIDWTPAIIALTAGIIAAIMGLVSYILYFQYPPLVRRVRSLRRKIKKGRSLKKTVEVDNREVLIKNAIRERLNILKIEPGMSKVKAPIK